MLRTIFRHVVASAYNYLRTFLLLLVRPPRIAAEIDWQGHESLFKSLKFFATSCTFFAIAWLFTSYAMGGATLFDSIFPTSSDFRKASYIFVALAWTMGAGLLMFLSAKMVHGDKASLRSFIPCFAYASGAIIFLIAIIVTVTVAWLLWSPLEPDEQLATRLNLVDAANIPAFCNEIRTPECQIALRSGYNTSWIIAIALFACLSYQALITAFLLRRELSIRAAPFFISMVLILVVVIFATQLAANAGMAQSLEGVLLARIPAKIPVAAFIEYNRCRADIDSEPAQAVEHCGKSVTADRRYVPGYINHCLAALRNRDFPTATDSCNRAVALNDSNPIAYLVRGSLRAEQEQWDNARSDFSKCIVIEPRMILCHESMAKIFFALKQWNVALGHLNRTIELNGSVSRLYAARANANIELGNLSEALADLKSAQTYSPDNLDILHLQGEIHLQERNFDDAIADFTAAIPATVSGSDAARIRVAKTYTARARAFLGKEEFDKAISDFSQAIFLTPTSPEGYHVRGILRAMKGEPVASAANHKLALQLLELSLVEPGATDAKTAKLEEDRLRKAAQLGNLSYFALFAGEYGRALEASQEAIKLAPDLLWIKTNMAHALMYLGRVDEAKKIYMENRRRFLGGPTWEQAISSDFDLLRKNRMSHSLMPEIEAALGIAKTQ